MPKKLTRGTAVVEDGLKKHLKFHLGMTLVINRYDHARVVYGTSTTDGVHVTLAYALLLLVLMGLQGFLSPLPPW